MPVLSKVYEKVILHQLSEYIEKTAVYNATQSGFRKGHSAQTLLLKFRDDIQKAINKNEITMSVLIDYSKAFDTIEHETLIKKLVSLNFSNSSIKIILSYLTNRRQYVQVNEKQSSCRPIYYGVPQGSILGPVLFNIYVSTLPSCIQSNSIQYADDTSLYKSSTFSNIQTTIQTLEKDISELCSWSENNGLVFNNDKLKSIVFTSKRNNTDRSFLIKSKGKSIEQSHTAKLLGVTFDHHLTWHEQINVVTRSTYNVLRILKTFKRFTLFKTRKCLAESLILSRLNYCNVVYGQLPNYLLKRLQRVQNCAAGYVLGRYATAIDIINLNWLPIIEGIEYNISKLTYQGLNDKNWPEYLAVKTETHKRKLRSSNSGPIIKHDEKNTFQAQANKVFNYLPINVRSCESKICFNKQARGFYKDKALARVLSL